MARDNDQRRRGRGPTAPSRDRERGGAALLIIDMVNSFDFPGADRMKPKAEAICASILKLRAAADAAGVPVIYVNDNFGEWHSNQSLIVAHARKEGGEIVKRIAPAKNHYFVVKPQFSGFYATNLPILLPKLGASRLIITGISTDICVLFTAADAHMRDYAVWIPSDAVAAQSDERGRQALAIARDSMGAQTAPTDKLNLGEWLARLDKEGTR